MSQGSYKISCFIVYSSKNHVDYINEVLEKIRKILEEHEYNPTCLSEEIRSTQDYYTKVRELIKACRFGIVVLDGLRPNIVFEFGLLYGLDKPIIVLKERNAFINIKNLYSAVAKEQLKDEIWFQNLQNPNLDLDTILSDYKKHYCEYSLSASEEDLDSLDTCLTNELTKILPELQVQTSQRLYDLKKENSQFEAAKLTIILNGLALLSYIGWYGNPLSKEDLSEFRKDFCEVIGLVNNAAEVETIVTALIKEGFVQRHGRHIILESVEITQEILEDIIHSDEIHTYFKRIRLCKNPELLGRFIERIKGLKEKEQVLEIASILLDDVELFPSWIILHDRLRINLFRNLSLISPNHAMMALNRLFSQAIDEQLRDIFKATFDANPYYPHFGSEPDIINGRNMLLWILADLVYYKTCFADAARLLYRMARMEEKKWINRAKEVFIEAFYPETFTQASLDERRTFLEFIDTTDVKSASILLSVLESIMDRGTRVIFHLCQANTEEKEKGSYFTPGEEGFNEREEYRRYACSKVLTLLSSKLNEIFDKALDLFNREIPTFLFFYGYQRIKEIWNDAIQRDVEYKGKIVKSIHDYQNYWRDRLSTEDLNSILGYQKELQIIYSTRDRFKRLLKSDMMDNDFNINDYKDFQERFEAECKIWAEKLYASDDQFEDLSDIIFSEDSIALSSLGCFFSQLDINLLKWEKIKILFGKVTNHTLNFIYAYLSVLKNRDNAYWEKIIIETVKLPEFTSYTLNLLLHYQVTDFIIDNVELLLREGKYSLKQVWGTIFRYNFENVSLNKISSFLKLIINEKELFTRKQEGLRQLKDYKTEDMIDGNTSLFFLNEILKKHEDVIPEIWNAIISLLTFLIDERNGLNTLHSWSNIVNQIVKKVPQARMIIFSEMIGNFKNLITRIHGGSVIEDFIVECYIQDQKTVLDKLQTVFYNEKTNYKISYIFGSKIIKALSILDLAQLVRKKPEISLPIIAYTFQDEFTTSKSIPTLIDKLILENANCIEFKKALAEIFIFNRVVIFHTDPMEPRNRDIKLLYSWKEQTQNFTIREWIDYIIEFIKQNMKREKDSHDELMIRP